MMDQKKTNASRVRGENLPLLSVFIVLSRAAPFCLATYTL